MSGTTRQAVMQAVFTALQSMTFAETVNNVNSWNTVSTKLRLWSNVSPDQQPAVFLTTYREMDEYRGLGLLRRRLELMLYCYCRSDNSDGQTALDNIMQAFEATFNVPDNPATNCNTLGGLVYWIRIEGKVFKDPGDLDKQALLMVPLVVEMP